ncbi:ABC transporter permease [Mucilaginibacter sp. UR6-11]|uniref:ABC transporter permease n=1 Tax=Mucilaginibacter sp. UR6-11 TaxID=1435644 RepID=UPI001E47C737|nr:ABC transporter permease [Mucilaginibacter sp. UR6-11]MCC8423733.1 ABC transporter permease [Mucilaginibacter sp. UR6-11]
METTTIPKASAVFKTLFKADMATLLSNRRSAVISLLVPLIILVTWKAIVKYKGGPFVLATSIAIGLIAIGLMGYTLSVARDRDKGIFQRLRVAPVPTWAIMTSRICIQLIMIMVLTLAVFIVGYQYDRIELSLQGYLLTFCVAILGGAVYLSLGQLIVGLIKNFETINATTRITYFLFIMVGMVGDLSSFSPRIKQIIRYSPYGSVKMMLAASMEPAQWNNDTTLAVLVCVGYIIVFAGIGIQKFRWNAK